MLQIQLELGLFLYVLIISQQPKIYCAENGFVKLLSDVFPRVIGNTKAEDVVSLFRNSGSCPPCESCIKHDRSIAADSLADALRYFPDLTQSETGGFSPEEEEVAGTEEPVGRGAVAPGGTPESTTPPPPPKKKKGCVGERCNLSCQIALLDKFASNVQTNVSSEWAERIQLIRKGFSLIDGYDPDATCRKYNPPRQALQHSAPKRRRRQLRCNFKRYGKKEWRRMSRSLKKQRRKSSPPRSAGLQSDSIVTDSEIIGERSVMRCARRGESEDGGTWIIQCDICWVVRMLPDNYNPRFVNELVCNTDGEKKCVSGFGMCRQRNSVIDVRKNIGTANSPRWVEDKITIGNCCDCKIMTGSPLHTFVSQ